MKLMKLFFLIYLLVAAMATITEAQSLEGCLEKCGDVDIHYPFGVGHQPDTSQNCFLDYDSLFNLTCNNSMLYFFNLPVSNISLKLNQIEISIRYSKDCYKKSHTTLSRSLKTGAFTVSSSQNKFVTIGCDAIGIFSFINYFESNFTYYSGCVSKCDELPPKETVMNDTTCSGTGCCEVDFRGGPNSIDIVAGSINNHTNVSSFNNCTYAMVVKRDWFSFSLDYLRNFSYDRVPVVLEWTVSNDSCRIASGKEDYACKSNSECVDSSFGAGYNCKCKSGFEGNPYHPNGCHDIDECAKHNICPMPRKCQNYPGYYKCPCPSGFIDMNGTACVPQSSNKHNSLIRIALGSSVALLVAITLVFTLCWAHKQRTLKQLRQKNFEQNGGDLLLQQLSSQHQGYNSTHQTKIFTEVELKNATNNFDESRILGRGGQGIVYKGTLPDNTVVAIKKSRAGGDPKQIQGFINEVFVLSQINHRNVVKLLGCCLETDAPLLVYEYIDNGTLLDHIDPSKNEITISWEIRLRIAAETANAISYLHSYASIPIIHRDIKSTNILLDHNLISKVSDFGASRLVPVDETHVTTVVQGTLGYLDPEYLHLGQLNEKSDVYSFGVVLIELLTGSKAVEFSRLEETYLAMYFVSSMKKDHLREILDKRGLNEENEHRLKEVALLARRCVRVKGDERPTMKEVAMELEGMIAMEKHHPWVKGEDIMLEESEYLLGHDGLEGKNGASTSASYDTILKEIALEIADGR